MLFCSQLSQKYSGSMLLSTWLDFTQINGLSTIIKPHARLHPNIYLMKLKTVHHCVTRYRDIEVYEGFWISHLFKPTLALNLGGSGTFKYLSDNFCSTQKLIKKLMHVLLATRAVRCKDFLHVIVQVDRTQYLMRRSCHRPKECD